jgi:BON domain
MSINRSNLHKLNRAASVAVLTGGLLFSAPALTFALAAPAAQQAGQNDGSLQSSVNAAISQDSSLQGQQISASVSQGQVTLSGTVQTNAQRQQAETLAVSVPGIAGILNNLKVTDANSPVPPPPADNTTQAAPPADDQQAQAQNPPSPAQDQQAQSQQPSQDQVPPPPPDQTAPPAANQGGYTATAPYSGARQPYQSQPGYYQQGPPAPPSGPVTVPPGTLIRIRLSETLDTKNLKPGAYFQATAAADVYQAGVLAIPRGAVLTGQVVEAKDGGALGGSAVLRMNLTSINLEGRTYPIATDIWSSKGPNKAGYTAANTVGGAAVGALIGGLIGRGAGAAIGAGVGGAAGLGASAASNGPRLILPTETAVDFHLTTPVTVQPVSWQEAQRLATASTPQQPRLIRRRPIYGYPYGYPPPPYGYPY